MKMTMTINMDHLHFALCLILHDFHDYPLVKSLYRLDKYIYERFKKNSSKIFSHLLISIHRSYDEVDYVEHYTCFPNGLRHGLYEKYSIKLEKIIRYNMGYGTIYRRNLETNTTSVIRTSRRGKQGRYISMKNGMVLENSFYVNDRLEGLKFTYFPDGKIECICNYKNGLMEGMCESFHYNGILYFLCYYYKGQKHGISRTWDFNGTMIERYRYTHDKLDGLSESWYGSGKKLSKEVYKDDKRISFICWNRDGSVMNY